MKKYFAISHLLPAVFFLMTACAPKAQVKPEFEKTRIASLAVLPVIDKTELPQAQIAPATAAFTQALRNAGFLILDDTLTQRVCPASPCEREKELFNDYLVDATVQLSIDSSTRANILAGYYNDISGSLSLRDKNGEELLLAQSTQREKGGLLFNSGQVLQGLISQFRDAKSNTLIEKLFRDLVAQIPNSNRTIAPNTDATTVAIKTVEVKAPSADLRHICVTATPKSLSSLVLGSLKSNLQEVSPGKYCREFFLNPSFRTAGAEVEVRSPYGNSVRQALNLQDIPDCDLKNSLALIRPEAGKPQITFTCPSTSGAGQVKLMVYRSESETPQFSKVGEFSGLKWSDSSAAAGAQYAVIARTSRGDRSLPVFLTPATSPSPTTASPTR